MSDRGHVPSPGYGDERPGFGREQGAGARRKIEQFDFGVRNTLLYYRDLKATLDLSPGSGVTTAGVSRLLAGERVLLSELFDGGSDALKSATKRVRSISYRTRRDVDKGAPGTLCLAWGMARWDNGRPTLPSAPIVLRQASVARSAVATDDFELMVAGPWSINTTLLRLLEIDFGVDVERGALGDLVEELTRHGDPAALFERVVKMADDVPGFAISPRVVMAPIPRVAIIADRDPARRIDHRDDGAVDNGRVNGAAVEADHVNDPAVNDAAVIGAAVEAGAVEAGAVEAGAVEAVHQDAGHSVGHSDRSPGTVVGDGVAWGETTALGVVRRGPGEAPGERLEIVRSESPAAGAPGEGEGSERLLERSAADAIIVEVTVALRGDGWPEALIEHADSGLRVRDAGELIHRWHDAHDPRPKPSRWDATHFALWGLAAAPPVGDRAIDSVSRWTERRHHPVLMAWQMVAEHRYRGHRRRGRGRLMALSAGRVVAPRGMDEALWGLPVDLLVEWANWVFRQWPGAPFELLLPAGNAQLVSAWYERARPVAELAVKTWVPFSSVEDDLAKSAQRWVKQLTTACDGGGAPLGTWFQRSMEVAGEAVALRVGAAAAAGPRTRAHAGHAI